MLNTPVPTAPCFCRKWSLHTLNSPFRSYCCCFQSISKCRYYYHYMYLTEHREATLGQCTCNFLVCPPRFQIKCTSIFYSQCCMKKNHNPTTPYRWVTSISEMCCPGFYHWINCNGSLRSFSITCWSSNLNWHLLPVHFLLHYQ